MHSRFDLCRILFQSATAVYLISIISTPFISSPMWAQTKQLDADALFERDHLVEVKIDLSKENWDKVRLQSRSFATALGKQANESPFEYVSGNVTIDGVKIENVGIRKKGFLGSLDEKRPSLKIKFSEYQRQSPVKGIDRLTLNNCKQDPGRIAQYLSYRLFNDSGTYAPRSNFAKVYVNGDYLGIYANVESIKPLFLARTFSDGDGALFEGTVTDFFPDYVKRFEQKNKQADYKLIQEVTDVLAAEPLDLAAVEKLINVESFVKFWAMESLQCYWDGYNNNQNNFYIYRNPADSKFYFIPWGTDSIFVRSMPLPPYRIRPKSVHCQSILANRLYRIPEVQQLYEKTVKDFLDQHFDPEKLVAEIDLLEALLEDHVLKENRSFARELRRYRSFAKSRRKEILAEFEDGPPQLKQRERQPIYFAPIGSATLTFSTKWYEKTPSKQTQVGDIEIEMEFDGKKVEFEEIGVYAEKSKMPSFGSTGRPPSIVIVGKRKSDGKRLTLGTGLATDSFAPGKKPVDIGGLFIEGSRFTGPGGQMRMIGGKVTLEAASMEKDQPVRGKMELTIVQMQGGQPTPEPKKK